VWVLGEEMGKHGGSAARVPSPSSRAAEKRCVFLEATTWVVVAANPYYNDDV
jgi:hypothetical protein